MNASYTNAVKYRNIALRAFAETTQYKWSDEFSRKECKEAKDSMKSGCVNPKDFTMSEAISLGFQKWSKDSTLMLIPMWLLPVLDSAVEVESISGEVVTVENIDNDNRGGLLAYGVRIEE